MVTAAKPVYSRWFEWKPHDTLEWICTATALRFVSGWRPDKSGHREGDHRVGPEISGNHLSNAQKNKWVFEDFLNFVLAKEATA